MHEDYDFRHSATESFEFASVMANHYRGLLGLKRIEHFSLRDAIADAVYAASLWERELCARSVERLRPELDKAVDFVALAVRSTTPIIP
jgi:hypothetical protein